MLQIQAIPLPHKNLTDHGCEFQSQVMGRDEKRKRKILIEKIAYVVK